MKKIIFILVSFILGIIIFLVTAYWIVIYASKKGNSVIDITREENKQFINPPNSVIPYTTSTEESSSSTLSFLEIPSSIIFGNIDPGNGSVMLLIEGAEKNESNKVMVYFKILTHGALHTTSINPQDFIKLTTPEGTETEATIERDSDFKNIPVDSEINGRAIFTLLENKPSVLLQVGKEEHMQFYEFNFINKTYKKADIS